VRNIISNCCKAFASHDTQRNTEAVEITEGDKMQMKVVEGNKIMIEKATPDAWKDCTDFLPVDFEKLLKSLRTDSTNRFKHLGLVP